MANRISCPVCKLNEKEGREERTYLVRSHGNFVNSYCNCNYCQGFGAINRDVITEIADENISFWQKVKTIIEQEKL